MYAPVCVRPEQKLGVADKKAPYICIYIYTLHIYIHI